MKFSKALTFIFLLAVSWNTSAQDSLNVKYQQMIEDTETFNQYKVIPRTRIDNFWAEVMDSLQADSRSIRLLTAQVEAQNDSIQGLSVELTNVQQKLDESLTQNNSIIFLGIELSKGAYHVIVWTLIVVVLILAGIFYMMFAKSNRITTRAKKELDTLQLAFEEHKNQSREKQIKLKRELQTAVNSIDEMKRGRG